MYSPHPGCSGQFLLHAPPPRNQNFIVPFLTSRSIFSDVIPSTGCLSEPFWVALTHHSHVCVIDCSRGEFVACFTCADQSSSLLCAVILSTAVLFGLQLIIKEPGSQSDQEKSAVTNALVLSTNPPLLWEVGQHLEAEVKLDPSPKWAGLWGRGALALPQMFCLFREIQFGNNSGNKTFQKWMFSSI